MAIRKETVKKQFSEALPAVLEPGETVQAGSYCVSGPNPLFATGLFGLVGYLIFNMRYYYLAVTDRRVVAMNSSFWTARPKGLAFADPRGSIAIADVVSDAKLWNHLNLMRPGAQKGLRLNFHAWWREEMKQIVSVLGSAAPPQAPGMPAPPAG